MNLELLLTLCFSERRSSIAFGTKVFHLHLDRSNSFRGQSSALFGGIVAQWCHLLTLKPEHSGTMGSIPGKTLSLERHDKGLRTRLGVLSFRDPSAWR